MSLSIFRCHIINTFYFFISKNIISEELANVLLYLSLTIIFILIYIKDIIKDFKNFKKDYKYILKTTFNYWLKGLFIMLAFSILISFINIAPNTNQEANIALFKEMPIVEILCAVIFAPLIEELVFRRGLKKFTNNKHLYAITTGLIFGLLHILSSISSPSDYIMFLYFNDSFLTSAKLYGFYYSFDGKYKVLDLPSAKNKLKKKDKGYYIIKSFN